MWDMVVAALAAAALMTGVQVPCRALAELCCDADSELGRMAPAYGLANLRITEVDRFDVAKGLRKAKSFIQEHDGCDAWAALPCTSWCTWQYINERKLGDAFCS